MTVYKSLVVDNEAFAIKVAEASASSFNPAKDHSICRVDSKGRLMGGVLYSRYTGMGGSIFMSVAGFKPNWLNRDLLIMAFAYPFDTLGCRKLFSAIRANNRRSLALNLRLGFKAESVMEHVYPGLDGDMILTSMYREDCRHLPMPPQQVEDAADVGQGR
jgi:RimJ/RimL family protein N-acetyltransferase